MLIRVALALAALLFASPALAVPVQDVLNGTDGNFSFSLVHSSTGCSDGQCGSPLDGITLGGAGGSASVSGGQFLLDVQLNIGGELHQATGAFDFAGLLDNSAQTNLLLGSLTLTGGQYAGTYFFKDRNYSSAALKPNSYDQASNTLSLWGTTNVSNPNAKIGEAIELSPGGTGIDLRVQLSSNPIPEPGAVALYLAGLGIVGGAVRRVARTAS